MEQENKEEIKPERQRNTTGKRVSFYGKKYQKSIESDWTSIDGIGFIHGSEMVKFLSEYARCDQLGTYHKVTDMAKLEGDRYVSKGCDMSQYVFSERMGCLIEAKDAIHARNELNEDIIISGLFAKQNFEKDSITGNLFPAESVVVICDRDDKKVWGGHKDVYFMCADCMFHFDILGKNQKRNGSPLCKACFKKYRNEGIFKKHDYNQYPPTILGTRTRLGASRTEEGVVATNEPCQVWNERMFGVEVETEISADLAANMDVERCGIATEILQEMSEFVIIKEDGTLTMNGKYSDPKATLAGFEIVSAPAPLEVHRLWWKKLENLGCYKALRAWDTTTCGLHVHVERKCMTHLQIGRMLRFINHNYNRRFIQKIAGRSEETYTRYLDKNISDCLHPERVINPEGENPRNRSRRVALNIIKDETVEFRIFRGTVNPKHIIRNIEFCDAVCSFCHPASRSLREMDDYVLFIKFVDQNRKLWPELSGWLSYHKMGVNVPGGVNVVEDTIIKRGGRHVLRKYVRKDVEVPVESELITPKRKKNPDMNQPPAPLRGPFVNPNIAPPLFDPAWERIIEAIPPPWAKAPKPENANPGPRAPLANQPLGEVDEVEF